MTRIFTGRTGACHFRPSVSYFWDCLEADERLVRQLLQQQCGLVATDLDKTVGLSLVAVEPVVDFVWMESALQPSNFLQTLFSRRTWWHGIFGVLR